MVRTTAAPSRPGAHGEREEEPGRRQARGVLAEVALVELERGLAVELVEHVGRGAGDHPLGAERVPAAERPAADPQPRSREGDRQDAGRAELAVPDQLGAGEARAVAGETPGDRTPGGRRAREAGDQRRPVDLKALGEHQHVREIRDGGELAGRAPRPTAPLAWELGRSRNAPWTAPDSSSTAVADEGAVGSPRCR